MCGYVHKETDDVFLEFFCLITVTLFGVIFFFCKRLNMSKQSSTFWPLTLVFILSSIRVWKQYHQGKDCTKSSCKHLHLSYKAYVLLILTRYCNRICLHINTSYFSKPSLFELLDSLRCSRVSSGLKTQCSTCVALGPWPTGLQLKADREGGNEEDNQYRQPKRGLSECTETVRTPIDSRCICALYWLEDRETSTMNC